MGEGKRVEKKEITAGTTVKAIVTGYISYGILVGFIVFMVGLFINWLVSQVPNANYRVLSVSLPILESIFLYFIMHGICKMSIFDVFKKCKTNPDKMDKITTRLNLFMLICVTVSIVCIIGMLILNFNTERKEIDIASYQYKTIHSEKFANQLTNEMISNFERERANTIISTIIIELGMTVTYFSLIPYQKTIIEKYNEF